MDTVTWTDDKLDVLDGKVDRLITRVDVLDIKVDERFRAVGERFDEVNRQMRDLRDGQTQLDDRFAAMQRTLVQVGFSMVVGLIGGLVALIAAVLITL